MNPLPPGSEVQVQPPPAPDQSTMSEAMGYIEKARAAQVDGPTIADTAQQILLNQQNFLQRMRDAEYAHRMDMIRTAAQYRMMEADQQARVRAGLERQNQQFMAELKAQYGKGDFASQVTQGAVDCAFSWVKSKF